MPARFPELEVDSHVGVLNVETPMDMNTARWNQDDDIVITGISARLPESSNIEEFKEQLFAGIDLITDDERRWPSGQ